MKSILKAVKPTVGQDPLPRFLLPELAYAVNNGLRFEYSENLCALCSLKHLLVEALTSTRHTTKSIPALRYTWRPKFHPQATIIFLSATTTKEYLENQLGREVNAVIGEQYYVQRENLHVAQLVNQSGSRTRLVNITSGNPVSDGDEEFRKNLKLFLQMVFNKHQKQRIGILTSLGCNVERAVALPRL